MHAMGAGSFYAKKAALAQAQADRLEREAEQLEASAKNLLPADAAVKRAHASALRELASQYRAEAQHYRLMARRASPPRSGLSQRARRPSCSGASRTSSSDDDPGLDGESDDTPHEGPLTPALAGGWS